MHLGQWRHLYRIVGDEGWLEESALAELTEELINQLTLTHGLIYVHALLLAECADLFLGLAVAVETGLFLDGIEDRQTAIWSLETDDVAINLALWLAVYGDTDRFEQLLCESHHPVVVLVLNIKLHTGELRVVVTVHTLVAEVLADFINTLETTYDEALQVELGSDTHVHILIERIEVGDEWAGRSTTGNALQGRSLYLSITCVVEYAAECAEYGSTLQEGFLYAIINDEVNVALAVTQLWIIELVVSHAILILHDREWLQALREQAQFLGVNRNLASLCAEYETLYTDEVTDIEEFLENSIIKVLVLVWTNLVAGDINLDSSL